CVNPDTDRTYCGATEGCGVDGQGSAGEVCEPGHVCNGGECSLSCPSNFVNCNGTCIDPNTSSNHCGATEGCGVDGGSAGEACGAGLVCNNGTCAEVCPPGFVNCGGECINPEIDRSYCGATLGCGVDGEGSDGEVCGAGYVCNQGACALSCAPGLVDCGGECIDPDVDRSHCGATAGCGQAGQGSAGSVCGSGEVCSDGVCSLSCPEGLIRCGDTCINPD